MTRLGLSVLAALLWTGCAKKEERAEPPPEPATAPPISAPEADRGRKACQAFVDQVCDCALKNADLTGDCELARSRPEALDMNLRASIAEGNATERDRVAIQANARKIAQACIEDSAALVKRGCAIPAVTGSGAGSSGSDPAGSSTDPPAAKPEPPPSR
jgi:hypothetical protein